MDVNSVLQSTLSTDASTRGNAERQLAQAAEANFSQYLKTLNDALANESAPTDVRMGAGLALKNSFSAREYNRLREVQARWAQGVDPAVKAEIKIKSLQTLNSNDKRVGVSAAQFVASVAAVEIPRNEWPDLMSKLVENVGAGSDSLKQASLTTIGFICESEDATLRESLVAHSSSILTAVIQGARKEEKNDEVRIAAITALSDSLEFVRSNFEVEGERNYIMQVVCEATQAEQENRIQAGAFGCLNRIMGLYYEKMKFYMERALYGLTVRGMQNDDEDVAKLAVEFWCTVCEEEIAIEDDNLAAKEDGSIEQRPHYNFARIASGEVVPTLLNLLTKQDEDPAEEEYNVSRAAYQCLQLFAQAIGGLVIDIVLQFVERNLQDADWRKRDAAVSAFGAIMDGPDEKVLEALAKQALPLLLEKMRDDNVHVRDSSAYALGRICELCSSAIDPQEQLPTVIQALFEGLSSNPRMAASCCWALMSIADAFSGEPGCATNPLSPHFEESISILLRVTEKPDQNTQLLVAAYEVLSTFVTNAATDSIQLVAKLTSEVIRRLESTIPMLQQVVSIEDNLILEEMQASLVRCILQIIQRLELEIEPVADQIMTVLLQLLSSVPAKSSVPEDVFAAIGAMASSLEAGSAEGDAKFVKYMNAFAPFLYDALSKPEEIGICSLAIGLVSDIVRSLGKQAQPYCDQFMNFLLSDLKSTNFSRQSKPSILQTIGDIAQAIGTNFKTYLPTVATGLQSAATHEVSEPSFDSMDYIVALRGGMMDAWSGIILGMKPERELLQPHIEAIFQLIAIVAQDGNTYRSEHLFRSTMGVIGDLADTFPRGEHVNFFRQDWILAMIKDVRTNKEFSEQTRTTARYAKEQIKRQTANASANIS